jgi:hypothetical protein
MRGEPAEPAPSGSGGRHFVRHGPSRRWMVGFGAALALTIVAAAILSYVGIKTVRASRAGRVVSAVTDPAAPGFEAFLEPTPTLAILQRDGYSLTSIAVLALAPGDTGGSVLLVSPQTRGGTDEDSLSLFDIAAFALDPLAAMPSLQAQVRFGITETAVVDDARWAELVAPVAPIAIDNPSAVGSFPAGPVALGADQVGPYLAARNAGETPSAALARHRAFYRAWLDAVAASDDPAAVPGEVESGVGRFVRALSSGSVLLETAPLEEERTGGAVRYQVDEDVMWALVGVLVPYPTAGVPGGRIRVRLLDGTGDPNHVAEAAPAVVPAGAEIVVVGNAEAFDYEETEIRYHAPGLEPAARELQAGLGGGRLVDDPRHTDAFDVTIVLGPDV